MAQLELENKQKDLAQFFDYLDKHMGKFFIVETITRKNHMLEKDMTIFNCRNNLIYLQVSVRNTTNELSHIFWGYEILRDYL
jgi:hypothetical protein